MSRIQVTVSAEDADAIAEAARRERLSASAWMRSLAARELERSRQITVENHRTDRVAS